MSSYKRIFSSLIMLLGILCVKTTFAENPPSVVISSSDEKEDENASPWSFHGQATYVMQWHPDFTAPYTGQNSMTPYSNSAQTSDYTLYLGRKLWSGAEFYINPEIDQGFGLSNTLGMAGYSSGEAYKVGAQDPYFRLPRAFLRQTIDLGGERIDVEDQPNQVATSTTSNNVVITVGKFSVVDIFDTNKYAHDPRLDFLNWAALDAGAFDYAADAWGFTQGASIEWNQDWWTLRSGFFTLSTVPNSTNLDLTFKQYQLVEEFEERHQLFGRDGKFKVLGFMSHGSFGTYQDAIAQSGGDAPDTSMVRSVKNRWGFALNLEQEITPTLGGFARFSWNDGKVEAVEFTEINQSLSFGLSMKGNSWKRHQDTVGVVQIFNSLSDDAKNYFSQGGMGILIGDGQLNYGVERITEIYYNMALTKNFAIGADYQFVSNPAYNRDRGPINIFGLRVRANF
jgi:high affinity Mn2+ porin